MSGLTAAERAELAEALAPDVYALVMETAHDSWRQWRFLNETGKARHRAEAAEIVTNALAPAVERILAARAVPAETLADRVRAIVARMGARQVDHRHENEVGHWGAQGRAYFYAGDIYDDYADLKAALALLDPMGAFGDHATNCPSREDEEA